MTPLRLITETTWDVKPVLLESKDKSKTPSYYITGIFMQGNLRNQNGRIYPTEVLAREMDRYHREFISKRRALGELNHANSPTVDLTRASHLITDMKQDGDNFVGKAKILSTATGNVVRALMDDGVQLAVSTRGLGSLKETPEGSRVQDDFHLSTVDIVSDPSAPDAFVRGLLEGKAWVWENGILKECAVSALAQRVDAAHRKTVRPAEKHRIVAEAFRSFVTQLQESVVLRSGRG